MPNGIHHHHAAPPDFVTRSLRFAGHVSPLALQHWVLHVVLPNPRIVRAKGMLQLSVDHTRQCKLNCSGRRRATCSLGDTWRGPPENILVVVGTDEGAVEAAMAAAEKLLSGPLDPA